MSSSYMVMFSYVPRRTLLSIREKQKPIASTSDINPNVEKLQEIPSTSDNTTEATGRSYTKPGYQVLMSLLMLLILGAAIGIPTALILTGTVTNGNTETTTTSTTTTTTTSTTSTSTTTTTTTTTKTTTTTTSTTSTTSTTTSTTTTTTTTSTTTTSTTSTTTTTTAVPPTYMFWTFDSTFNDFYNVYNGVGRNGATFVTPGYNGYGAALSVNGTNSQYVLVTTYKNMTYTSFTWEMWAYPINLENYDNLMVGMCETTALSRCLYLMIRTNSTYFAFFGNDCWSSTFVPVNQWHHFGFVYDYAAQTQYVYLDGYLTCTHTSSGPFLGSSGAITIGAINNTGGATPYYFWTGYIDEVSFVSRAKTAAEVLDDATLVAYYSFDNGSFYDFGPNRINGTGVGVTSVVGRVNRGILFNADGQYFQASGFVLLGATYQSYSISLWIYKSSPALGNGTIIHLSALASGLGWCLPILGLSSSYQIIGQNWNAAFTVAVNGPIIPLATWTHVVTSYSATNGMRLWVNGTLIGSTGPFSYGPSSAYNTVTLGSSLAGQVGCVYGNIVKGQFYGMMDELRIYSRELNSTEVYTLANP